MGTIGGAIVKRVTVNGVLKSDPTRTLSLRRSFMNDIQRRFTALKKEITHAVDTLDVFGLKERSHQLNILTTNLEPRQFEFSHSDQKIDQFMKWLDEMVQKQILTVTSRTDFRVGEKPWTNLYIQSAYQRGISRARAELRRNGYNVPSAFGVSQINGDHVTAAFNQPFHADRVAMIYTRTYNELQGITNAMSQQISRVLAQGMAEGRSPFDLARDLSGRVDAIGITRGRTLARTEVVNAHHQATINEYEQWGVQGVAVQAEWVTAGFGVCPLCLPLEGKVFSLKEIRGMIPRHPNCRCVALPVYNPEKVKKTRAPRRTKVPALPTKPPVWKLPDGIKILPKGSTNDYMYDYVDEVQEHYRYLANKFPGIKMIFENVPLDTHLHDDDTIKKVTGGRIIGRYEPDKRIIQIAAKLSKDDGYKLGLGVFNTSSSFLGTVRHELGHHVHAKSSLIAAAKKESDRFIYFNRMDRLHRMGMGESVCKYAQTSDNELFATAFTVFTNPDYKNDLPYEIHKFFVDLLM